MHKNDKQRAEEILEGYFGNNLSSETDEVVQGWLVSDDNPEKEKLLAELFADKVKKDGTPGQNTKQSLAAVHAKLGFPEKKKAIPLRRKLGLRIAAVLIPAAIVAGALLFVLNEQNVPDTGSLARVTVVIPAGDNKTITLPDGSEIQVAEATEISYSEDFLKDRTVNISGEGYFKVTKWEGKTFTVKSDHLAVTVLGTEFNVKAYAEENTSEVKLTTGRVSIQADGIEDETVLVPGQHYVYNKHHKTIKLEEIGERELMRMRGMSLDFNNSLDEVFGIIGKYFNLTVKVDPGLEVNRTVVAPFDNSASVTDVMEGLQFMTGNTFGYQIKQDTITVTRTK